MDKIYYKNKLKNDLFKVAIFNKNLKDYMAALDRQGSLVGLITARIMELTPVSPSDAKTYIDYRTGKFKGGRAMPHCLDTKLKQLFAEHESMFVRMHKTGITNLNESMDVYKADFAKIKNFILEMKKDLGERVAKEVYDSVRAEVTKETGIEF